ncbi:MAG: hypothetical protein JSW25_07775 [Thermoplasmata archaeon]|nr:MAG: hypothetical protein JSW25_07775 [Thermoplasmata archaeon]
MVERHLVVLLCACIAIVGTLALAAWLERETSVTADLGDLEDIPLGTLVTVEGTIDEVPLAGPNVSVLVLRDAVGNMISVFMGFDVGELSPGSRLRATGRLAVYQGNLEVVVEVREDLEVLSRPRSPEVELNDLMRAPWGFEGMEPIVRVRVLASPMADSNGEDWWCLVGDPSTKDGDAVLLLISSDTVMDAVQTEDQLDLRVAVRYDPSSGFVFLEVADLA